MFWKANLTVQAEPAHVEAQSVIMGSSTLFSFLFLPQPVKRPRKLVLKMLDSQNNLFSAWTRGPVL